MILVVGVGLACLWWAVLVGFSGGFLDMISWFDLLSWWFSGYYCVWWVCVVTCWFGFVG